MFLRHRPSPPPQSSLSPSVRVAASDWLSASIDVKADEEVARSAGRHGGPPADWRPAKGSLCMALACSTGRHVMQTILQHNAHGVYFHPTQTADKSTPTNGLYFVCLEMH